MAFCIMFGQCILLHNSNILLLWYSNGIYGDDIAAPIIIALYFILPISHRPGAGWTWGCKMRGLLDSSLQKLTD